VKIKKVEPDNRRRRFDVTTSHGTLPFPFGGASVQITEGDWQRDRGRAATA
jgi:hypothetical protein